MKVFAIFLLIAAMGLGIAPQGRYEKKIEQHRREMDEKFRNPQTSPLRELAHTYTGQDYYPPDKTYRVRARLERTPEAKPFRLPTSNPEVQKQFVQYGILHFSLHGKACRLSVYRNLQLSNMPQYKDLLFLPFADQTSGLETYGGGRYLDLEVPKGNKMVLDFNLCYNPYCAYSEGWSCPIIPRENYLPVPVRAGVKKYDKHAEK